MTPDTALSQKLTLAQSARLQRSYITVPGPCTVSSKDLYKNYERDIVTELFTKKKVCQMVPIIFDQVKVCHVNGPNVFQGLRPRFNDPAKTDVEALINISAIFNFVKMKQTNSTIQFTCYTGYTVNKHEQVRNITIDLQNRSFKVSIDTRPVALDDIGLLGLKIETTIDAEILFNTVKHCKVCCGKLVNSKLNTTKYSFVQEWYMKGDENSGQLRLTSKKCRGVAHFLSLSGICNECQKQTVNKLPLRSKNEEPTDPEQLLSSIFPGAPELTLKLLKAQSDICHKEANNTDPRARRWDKEIIQVCLTLWNRSPQGYNSLRDSGMLYLPSPNLLQRYKNCLSQSPGLNSKMLQWMHQEAKRMNVDMRGGIILDEIGVQDDLKMSKSNNSNVVDGLVDIGMFAKDMNFLNTKSNEIKLATHVLQFIFLSYDGFRFPFAYYPTITANAPELYSTVWEAISKLSDYEFEVDYVCLDGASNNRSLQMMHFEDKEDAKLKNFSAGNPYGGPPTVTFIMDYSHNIKKLRNNIYSSRTGAGAENKRHLRFEDQSILWDHWIKAYQWDKLHNPVRVHRKLTNDHLFLTKTSKMRNYLAEEVLNSDMLNLMEKYSQTLTANSHLTLTLKLLTITSKVIDFFRDRRPIADTADQRLDCLFDLEQWLDSWSSWVSGQTNTAPEKAKMILSKETLSDLYSMCRGFINICQRRITVHKRSLVPAGINSDVIENFFCQQRTLCNGSNNNPTVYQYKYGINATILGQNSVSKKCNVYSSCKRKFVQPFDFVSPEPIHQKKSRIM